MTVINRAKFHHFPAKDTKVIDGGGICPPPQADSVLKRPGEIGLRVKEETSPSPIYRDPAFSFEELVAVQT